MLLALILVYSGIVLILSIETTIFTGLAYKVYAFVPIIKVFLIFIIVGHCGMFIGIGLSTICPNIVLANTLMMALSLTLSVISGFFMPVERMSRAMQFVSRFLPISCSAQAIIDILMKNFDISQHSVMMGYLVPFIWLIIGLTSALIVLKMRKFSRISI